MKRQILLLALLLSVTVNAFAEEAEIGGLWYELVLKAKEAKVIQNKYGIKYTGDIVIPETVEYEGVSYSVTGIGRSAFYNCNNLKSITIPNCIKSIGNAAFYECSGLTSVYITDIDAWCKITFSDCDSNPLYNAHHLFLNEKEITDLVIPNSVKSIGDYAFYYCIGLKSVIIQGGVTSIGNYAFSWCGGMTSVIIQNGVASIGHDAFYACSGLTSISIPNSIVTIGRYAFSGCINLISANIPGNVTSIGNNTFYECRSLTTVTIQDGVKSIGLDAFHGCAKLTSVTVPNSVTWRK